MGPYGIGQDLKYYDNIAPIIITNCAPCHRVDGLGPFPLTNYDQVKKKGEFIAQVVESKYMPPWLADPDYSHFKNERVLKPEDIALIRSWVDAGMKKGTERTQLNIPELNEIPATPDLVLEMSVPYNISDQALEDFRFFHVPTGLKNDQFVESIEFVPGNRKKVHHSRVMTDTSNLMMEINGLSELDPAVRKFQEIPLYDDFLYGWVPGNMPIKFPKGTGKKLLAGTDLILNIHYAPSSKKETDQSKIHLYFSKQEALKEIKTLAIREEHISNQPFLIPANTKKSFTTSYPIKQDINVVSLQPHMHYLGSSFKAQIITPNGELIPLIKINSWDFNWQTSYLLQKPLKIQHGSVILITAEYDNTAFNPFNPNHPPRDVGYGWNSVDEMMNFIIYFYEN